MGDKIQILVVDENVDLVDSIRTLLESQGYQVSCAYGADQARDQLLERRPALVVLDSSLAAPLAPEEEDVLREWQRPALRSTPVLILVGAEGALSKVVRRGPKEPYGPPRAYLEKPFRPQELLAEVQDLLVLRGEASEEASEEASNEVLATVLVVDDDPDFVEITSCILRAHGYGVLTAANGREALDLLHQRKPDLVLLDIMMSTVLDGLSVSESMRADAEMRRIPIIIISSIPNTEYAATFPAGEDIHMHDWLTKPVKPEELLKKVRRQLK
ncbi:MAG: response regulator [Anaerolineae bacterium]